MLMGNKKLDLFRHRDFEELLTITYEFIKQNIFQYAKFAFIAAVPFIILSSIFGFDLLISKQLNIFELFNQLKLETSTFNPVDGPVNLFAIILYLIIVSVMGALSYAYVKLYKDGVPVKKMKLADIWKEGNPLILWLLLFNGIVFFLLAAHMYFLGFLNVLITISYTLFVWGFTLLMLSFTFLISSNIISWGSVYILIFVFILVPVFIFSFWLFIRCILLVLYSVPLKLEEPHLNFTHRLVKCYQLIEGEALKSWVFIHTVSLALFFITYVSSMPIYGLIQKIVLSQQVFIGGISEIFFKCLSYGLVVLLSGLMHLAISISFYSLYAKIKDAATAKHKHLINEPISYPIHENGV